MFDDIFESNFFDDAIEDVDMYDDDYDYYDDAYEDVDIFDENYFEAMEGPARDYRHKQNRGKRPEQIQRNRERNYAGESDFNPGDDRSRNNRKRSDPQKRFGEVERQVGPNTISFKKYPYRGYGYDANGTYRMSK